MFKTKSFLRAYIAAALWSSHGPDEGPFACENLDDYFDADDISLECRADMRSDCLDFIKSNFEDLQEYCQSQGVENAGYDFWLTRNRHGAGFWDRGLGDLGDRLSAAARVYGGVDLYPGDDGLIYGS